MRFLATVNEHTVVVDAAPEDGGGSTATNAPGLFAAAFAASVEEFVLNSCRLHGVAVEHLSLEMAYNEVPGARRIGVLRATLHLDPEPDEGMRRRLVAVASHATLPNTLLHPPELDIEFAGGRGGTDADL